jgi:hypothetical protein
MFSLFGGDWRIGRTRVRPVDSVLFDTLAELSSIAHEPVESATDPTVQPVQPDNHASPAVPRRALLQWAGLSEEIDKEFKEAGYVIWSEDGVSQLAD